MNESTAREVVLVRAADTAEPELPGWGAAERAWASRVAAETVGPDAGPEAFVVSRTQHALQRLLPRDAAAHKGFWRWLQQPLWNPGWLLAALLVGLLAGLVLDHVGPAQRINLLAPPVWAVVAWNLLVLVAIAWQALRDALSRRAVAGGTVSRALQRLMGQAAAARWPRGIGGSAWAPVWAAWAREWARRSAPLAAARAAAVLHVGAAALAGGMIAGLYLRGLVLDYRVGWQSTFLEAPAVHRVLSIGLGPASRISGVALPDLSTLERLRLQGPAAAATPAAPTPAGSAVASDAASGAASGEAAAAASSASPGSTSPSAGTPDSADAGSPHDSAAPWIHLYAWTLLLAVVLPRGLLALVALARARWRAAHFPLPLDEPYHQALRRHQRGRQGAVVVVPHAQSPDPQATLGLRAVCARVWGESVQLAVQPPVGYGHEEQARDRVAALPAGAAALLLLVDAAATPEDDTHGRCARELAAAAGGVPVVMVVDETAFRARFGAAPERGPARRTAWQALARTLGSLPLIVELARPDLDAAEAVLQAALDRPIGPAPAAAEAG